MTKFLNWIDVVFFGYRRIYAAGVEMPERPAANIYGVGVTVTDDVANNRTNVAISAGSFDSLSPLVNASSGTYQAKARELVRVDTTAGPCTIALPSAVDHPLAEVFVKVVGDGDSMVTVSAPSGQTIDGANNSHAEGHLVSLRVVSDGSNWLVVSENNPG
ncbi:hypothetical protein WME76_02345 [Sorangium sp. So ce119]|uniref:hypothetical protein n=1 Tax=Sorangium sp. So ce119 TaxID=3133279 RepID=UPI003F623C4A